MSTSPSTEELIAENQLLREELDFYRSILFADISPQGVSLYNALQHAVDIREENSRLRNGEEFKRISHECTALRAEVLNLQARLEGK
jgi:hypothetical protein